MTTLDLIGSVGVGILLIAFFLNLFEKLRFDSYPYIVMNIVGSGISCVVAVKLSYLPFVVLEGTWMSVAFFGLIKRLIKGPKSILNQ